MTIIFKIKASIVKVYINVHIYILFCNPHVRPRFSPSSVAKYIQCSPSVFAEDSLIFWLSEFCSLGYASVRPDVDGIPSPWVCRTFTCSFDT